jgi:hypothetical protein
MYLIGSEDADQSQINLPYHQQDSPKGTLDGVQVVGTDGNQFSSTTQVLMQFVLQVDERVVCCLAHGFGETEHGRSKERSDGRHLREPERLRC